MILRLLLISLLLAQQTILPGLVRMDDQTGRHITCDETAVAPSPESVQQERVPGRAAGSCEQMACCRMGMIAQPCSLSQSRSLHHVRAVKTVSHDLSYCVCTVAPPAPPVPHRQLPLLPARESVSQLFVFSPLAMELCVDAASSVSLSLGMPASEPARSALATHNQYRATLGIWLT